MLKKILHMMSNPGFDDRSPIVKMYEIEYNREFRWLEKQLGRRPYEQEILNMI